MAIADLKRTIPMPDEILLTYLERLIERGFVEKVAGGLVVPTAVFTEPGMLKGANELYDRVVVMVQAMRAAGFAFGDHDADSPAAAGWRAGVAMKVRGSSRQATRFRSLNSRPLRKL